MADAISAAEQAHPASMTVIVITDRWLTGARRLAILIHARPRA
jgi:DNA-binding MurR/RpiR family transcriptional regulator